MAGPWARPRVLLAPRGEGAPVGKCKLSIAVIALQRIGVPQSVFRPLILLLITFCWKPENDFIFNDSCTHISLAN